MPSRRSYTEPARTGGRLRGRGDAGLAASVADDVRRLGVALGDSAELVLARTSLRTARCELKPELAAHFEHFNVRSTMALGRWLSGEGQPVAREAGRDTWTFYGEMAARNEVALHAIVTRCLAWRDAVAETLAELADELGVDARALRQAVATLQASLEYSLVRIAKTIDCERERTEHELVFMATHDRLTGLPNRSLTIDGADQLLVRARRSATTAAAVIVGLDNLDSFCETLGRERSEELLRAIAERLDGCVRDVDVLGRVGADDFAIVVEDSAGGQTPLQLAERLRATLREPFPVADDSGRVTVSCCVGAAVGPRSSGEELLRDAEIAMRHARWEGTHRVALFEPGMELAVEQRRELEVDVREALARDQLELAFQPVVAVSDLSVTGVEALLRWQHPSLGSVPPSTFVPLLERDELIVEVGGWVLDRACRFAARCSAPGRPLQLAVNVSPRQLDHDELVTHVREALAASGLAASSLTLEITETTLMRNVQAAVRTLCSLHELGVRIAIDDFGTGYSSLSHLHRFPIDELKIDRAFVSRLDGDDADPTLVRTMIKLGKELSIDTVAEGIETHRQLEILRDAGCDRAQGFLLSRPLDADAAEAAVRAGTLAPIAPAAL